MQDVPGFPVEILNVLGAGDAFASGFIYGYLQGWDIYKACRLGNASGAWVVQKPGCANDMPYHDEIMEFVESRGGLLIRMFRTTFNCYLIEKKIQWQTKQKD